MTRGESQSDVERDSDAIDLDALVPWLPSLPGLAIVVVDIDEHRFVRANDTFCELIGRAREDIERGINVFAVTAEASRLVTASGFDEVRATGALRPFEKTYTRPDGALRRAWVTAALLPRSKRYVIAYVLDVTEREAALAASRESEERARTFARASLEGLFIHDKAVILDANEVLAKMFGVARPEDLVGHSAQEFTDPSCHELMFANVRVQYDQPYELVGRRVDGTTFPIEVLGKPLRVGDRMLRVTAVRDITERKRTENALREAEMALLQAQKLESLGLLAGGIAHDFNNILGIVLGFAAVAKRHVADESPARRALDEIEAAAMRAAELARQMLVYSGRSPKSVAELSLNGVVLEMTRLIEASISKKIAVKLALDADAPSTLADRVQIQQVVINLLTNAADAIGDKRGEIRVSTQRVELAAGQVPAAQPGAHLAAGTYVELAVRDDGCGMDEVTMARVFDPFFTTKASGRGLGLSAMLGILRGHGGGLVIETKVGEGTCFRLFFPASANGARAPSAPPPRRPEPAAGSTVLLVDDETALRRSTRELLESDGHRVLEAKDGAEAIAVFREQHAAIALVLLDLVMPAMDGREALAALRAIDPDARIVLMSGYDAHEVLDGIRSDVTGFLAKPFTPDALFAAVRAALAA